MQDELITALAEAAGGALVAVIRALIAAGDVKTLEQLHAIVPEAAVLAAARAALVVTQERLAAEALGVK